MKQTRRLRYILSFWFAGSTLLVLAPLSVGAQTVAAGGLYDSYVENSLGDIACGGLYSSYAESKTGEVCCGGRYGSWHVSRTGKVCAGGLFDGVIDSTSPQQPGN